MVTTRRKSAAAAASATPDPKTPANDRDPHLNTRNPKTPFSSTAITPASVKSVLLQDWWLVKAKGKGLAVGGFACRERLGVRVFCSAAISKRHSATVLETVDGIMITVSGCLNRSRTHQNGFPSELYDHFLLGFPFDWEEYAAVVTGEDSIDIVASMRNSAYKKFNVSSGTNESNSLPFSLDDLPVTRARDLSMFSFGDSDYCSLVKSIFSDIPKTSRDNASGHTKSPIGLNMENRSPAPNVDSGTTETPVKHKKVKVKEDKNPMTEENKKIRSSCSVGVLTRSMTRRSMTRRSTTRRSTTGRSMTGSAFHNKNDKKEDYTKTHDQKKVVAHQLFRQRQRRNKEQNRRAKHSKC